MKILCICENGNNRSVQFAHLLRYKYKGADTIPVGVKMHSAETLEMLYKWADHIIVVDNALMPSIPAEYAEKVHLWNVGEDIYPRPFNKVLNSLARTLIEKNPLE